jgi:hypothetical protein
MLDPQSAILGGVIVYGIILHMTVVYLATARKFGTDTLSAREKDLAE